MRLERGSFAVRQVPSRFLRNVQVSVKHHARYALERGCCEIDGDVSSLVANIGRPPDGSCIDAESLAAILDSAAIRLTWMLWDGKRVR